MSLRWKNTLQETSHTYLISFRMAVVPNKKKSTLKVDWLLHAVIKCGKNYKLCVLLTQCLRVLYNSYTKQTKLFWDQEWIMRSTVDRHRSFGTVCCSLNQGRRLNFWGSNNATDMEAFLKWRRLLSFWTRTCLVEIILSQNVKKASLRQLAVAFDLIAISHKPMEAGK